MDDSVYYKRLQVESFRMLRALSDHMPLEKAIDMAFVNSAMGDYERVIATQRWFANWAELGWFCRPKLTLLHR
jgi:hypothetical protein